MLGLASTLTLGAAVPAANADSNSRALKASLAGAKEVPGPGDPDGSGSARVELRGDQVCFTVSWQGIDAPTAAHIHVGASDVAGPVVVPIFVVPGGIPAPVSQVGGCATADALVKAIRERPRQYYVNVHNPAFPAGAIRGQLHP